MTKTNDPYEPLQKVRIVVGLGLGLWNTYLTFEWLVSPHPWGAIYPALFAGFFSWTAYSVWTSTSLHGGVQAFQIFGVLAAAGIAVMWIVAKQTRDDVYLDQARDISAWGGFLVLGGLFMGAIWIHPKARERIRASKRGEVL